ncbi:MAG TPA: HD-GYP domain-containing protein [Planctomycetota bacterium]
MPIWRSLRVRGALVAAGIAGGVAFLSGSVLRAVEEQARTQELADGLVEARSNLLSELEPMLARNDFQRIPALLATELGRHREMSAVIVDKFGPVLYRAGVDAQRGQEDLESMRPLGGGLVAGVLGETGMLELRHIVSHDGQRLGELRLRARARPVAWAHLLPWFAGGGALWGFLSFWLFLGVSLRPSGRILGALASLKDEEFWHRAPVTGCGEMRAIATTMNAGLESIEHAAVKARDAYLETAKALARAVEAKDRYTSGHNQRVTRYSVEIGEWLGFDKERLEILELGALLHDVGKVAVPDTVLLKPGPLTPDEYEVMKKHPMAGDRILSAIPGMRDIADVARSHHEKWDGSGYPLGAGGESIPLEGRIVAIADAFDTLTTKRSYKEALPVADALGIIEADAGTHFDPELARLFVSMKRNGVGYKGLQPNPRSEPPQCAPSRYSAPVDREGLRAGEGLTVNDAVSWISDGPDGADRGADLV